MAGRGIVARTQNVNTPSIQTGATALAANPARLFWQMQNVGQGPIRVCLGGTASATVFHFVLKGGSADNDGLGAISAIELSSFTGAVTIDGTTPKYVVLEL